MESAQIVKAGVERLDSRIAGGVRSEFLKMRSYAICIPQKGECASQFALLSGLVSLTGDSHGWEENNTWLSLSWGWYRLCVTQRCNKHP